MGGRTCRGHTSTVTEAQKTPKHFKNAGTGTIYYPNVIPDKDDLEAEEQIKAEYAARAGKESSRPDNETPANCTDDKAGGCSEGNGTAKSENADATLAEKTVDKTGGLPEGNDEVKSESVAADVNGPNKKEPEEKKSMAIRPCCLRLREEGTVEQLRKCRVEMIVRKYGLPKPERDGQQATLGNFRVTSDKWEVYPDDNRLWDVFPDGKPAPWLMGPDELQAEKKDVLLIKPMQAAAWVNVEGQLALYAARPIAKGEVIFEEEPAMRVPTVRNPPPFKEIWLEYRSKPEEMRAALRTLSAGSENLPVLLDEHSLPGVLGEPSRLTFMTQDEVEAACPEFHVLSDKERQEAWRLLRIVVNNFFSDSNAPGQRLLYLHLSRANHSCMPNAVVADPDVPDDQVKEWEKFWDKRYESHKLLIAAEDIAEGEEITINYLQEEELLEPCFIRQERLAKWGFQCTCLRCVAPTDPLRKFCCKATENCAGVHQTIGMESLSPCDVCGRCPETADIEHLLAEESRLLKDFIALQLSMTLETPLKEPSVLETLVEQSRVLLSPEHWLVCRVKDLLSLWYRKNLDFEQSAEYAKPMVRLFEHLGTRPSSRRATDQEMLADCYLMVGRYADALGCYRDALQDLKYVSPLEAKRFNKIRRKIRATLDARVGSTADIAL